MKEQAESNSPVGREVWPGGKSLRATSTIDSIQKADVVGRSGKSNVAIPSIVENHSARQGFRR